MALPDTLTWNGLGLKNLKSHMSEPFENLAVSSVSDGQYFSLILPLIKSSAALCSGIGSRSPGGSRA